MKLNPKRLERLNDILDEMPAKEFVSGCSCMVLQHGKEICYYERGCRDLEQQLPLTRDTIFRLYSLTKPMTAVAAMLLIEDGKLDLLTKVADYFPSFENQYWIKDGQQIPVQTPMQVHHLLNMTSGLIYPDASGTLTDQMTTALVDEVIAKLHTEDALTTEQFVSRLGEIPLLFEPGTRWNYGLSADVLAALIEKVSGMSFRTFMQKRLFEPLGMANTDFYVPQEKQHLLASVYDWDENRQCLVKKEPDYLGISTRMERTPLYESGGAGLVSTIDDVARFANMLTAHGKTADGTALMSEKTWQYLTGGCLNPAQKTGIVWENLPGYTYGNLMRVLEKPQEAITLGAAGEYGWDGWLGAYMTNDPENELTFLMLNQRMYTGTTLYTRKMRNIVYSSLE